MSDYYEDLEIDPYNLLEEWQHQAGLYLSYAKEGVDEQQVVDDLKDEVNLLKAQLEMDIRTGAYALWPEGLKVTDKPVLAAVTTDPCLVTLKKKYNKAKKEVNLLGKVEIAFDQRKKALENIVVLTGREQYAEPRDKTKDKTIDNEKHKNTMKIIDDQLNEKRGTK